MNSHTLKWIMQRLTAILLIPLSFWFVYICIFFQKISYAEIIIFFSSYLNSFLFLTLIVSMLIHSKLGCETIIEDYVKSAFLKNIILLFIQFIIYFSIFISFISIFIILF